MILVGNRKVVWEGASAMGLPIPMAELSICIFSIIDGQYEHNSFSLVH